MTVTWWQIAGTIAAPIIALFVRAWLNWRAERSPVLNTFYQHVAAFKVALPDGGTTGSVHTHAVVIRNVSRKVATNVRLHHNGKVPDVTIYPPIAYHRETLTGGTEDIVIPSLPPEKEITVSYLYFPPLIYDQIHAGIDCDQGIAQAIPVLLQRQLPAWIIRTNQISQVLGTMFLLYIAYRLALVAVARMAQ
jgi:hypothetical protein